MGKQTVVYGKKMGGTVKKTDGNFSNEQSFHSFVPLNVAMETKERILIKARELFIQYGIRSVSMDDIANNLGMSKKTLYQFFADKDELVDAVVEGHVADIQEQCLECRRHSKDAVHEIFLTMENITGLLSNMNPMLLFDMEKFHHRAYRRFREYKEKFLAELIRKNLEWGMREKLYRPDLDVEVMVKFRLESLMIPFNVSVFPPGRYNLAAASNELILHFIYGLASIKGHKLIQKYHDQRQKNHLHENSK